MNYTAGTIKYLGRNPLLWVTFIIAAAAFFLTTDISSGEAIAESFSGGTADAAVGEWILLFLPFSGGHWWDFLVNFAGYIALALDLAAACAAADRHMRYNSLSRRGIWSYINANIIPCAVVVLTLLVVSCIAGVIMGAFMAFFSWIGSYIYIVGIVLCCLALIMLVYVASFFILWLPCYVISGFRVSESLGYAYGLNSQHRMKIFLSAGLPTLAVIACALLFPLFLPAAATAAAVPILEAALFIYLTVLAFIAYLDADGIQREDLRKY